MAFVLAPYKTEHKGFATFVYVNPETKFQVFADLYNYLLLKQLEKAVDEGCAHKNLPKRLQKLHEISDEEAKEFFDGERHDYISDLLKSAYVLPKEYARCNRPDAPERETIAIGKIAEEFLVPRKDLMIITRDPHLEIALAQPA